MDILLLETPVMGVFQQMALDEILLGRGTPFLRFYRWGGAHVTFGYFQKHKEVVEAVRLSGRKFQALARRPTGGGIVFHDGDTTFSLVLPGDGYHAPPDFYERLHRGISDELNVLGLRTEVWDGHTAPGSVALCFAAPSRMDVVWSGAGKLLGGAMRKTRGNILYQGSLRREGMAFAPGIAEQAVVAGVQRGLGASVCRGNLEESLMEEAVSLAESKYKTAGWSNRR